MNQFRFEFNEIEDGLCSIIVYCLLGNFSTGVIKNSVFTAKDLPTLQKFLNSTVATLAENAKADISIDMDKIIKGINK